LFLFDLIGALVYHRRSDNSPQFLGGRQSANPVSDVYAFECVNGLERGTVLQFVGWAVH